MKGAKLREWVVRGWWRLTRWWEYEQLLMCSVLLSSASSRSLGTSSKRVGFSTRSSNLEFVEEMRIWTWYSHSHIAR